MGLAMSRQSSPLASQLCALRQTCSSLSSSPRTFANSWTSASAWPRWTALSTAWPTERFGNGGTARGQSLFPVLVQLQGIARDTVLGPGCDDGFCSCSEIEACGLATV